MTNLKCQHCGKIFSKSFNLCRHISAKHSNLTVESRISNNLLTNDIEMTTEFSSLAAECNQMPPSRMRYNQNISQKKYYEENKLNFHLSKVYLETDNDK